MGKTEDLFMRMIEERIEAFKEDLGDVYFDEDVKSDFQSKNVYHHLPRSGMWIREDMYYALKHSESLRDESIFMKAYIIRLQSVLTVRYLMKR